MKQIQPKPIEQWPRDSSAKTKLSLTADLIYIHLLFKTHRNFSVHYDVPNMEVIGISNTSERCSAEGRITVLVRDSTGKLLNLDLGIGYSSRLVPKSIISVAQLMTKGSIFHFERGNCYLRTPTNQRISITERNGHFYMPLKELQNGDAKTDEDESAQGSNEQQPFLGFAGTVETDEDTCNIKEKQLQLIAQEERLEPTALNTQLSQQRATRRSQKHIFHGYRKQLTHNYTARGYHQYLGPTPPLMHAIYITESLV